MNIPVLHAAMQNTFHTAGAMGSGIVFAVLDTGVKEVGALAGRVEGIATDTNGHGTAVAGLLLSWCPDAMVRSYRVLPGGTGHTEVIISALWDGHAKWITRGFKGRT